MSRPRRGRYRIVAPLGRRRHVARLSRPGRAAGRTSRIKLLRPQFAADPGAAPALPARGRARAQLDHPGIVRLLDAGEEDGVPFLVMELIEARRCASVLERDAAGWRSMRRARSSPLARALEHAHSRGIIHRDVKPRERLRLEGGVKLGDFGNARVVSLASVTGASLTWGTPEYVAPEVFMRGRAIRDPTSIRSAPFCYEMLTGRLPWSRPETLTRLAGRAGSARAFRRHGAPAEIVVGCSPTCWRSRARDRPASGAEAIARLSNALAAAVRRRRRASLWRARADDVPRCLSCGAEVLRLRTSPNGAWRLVLRKLDDDAAATAKLLRLLDPIAPPRELLYFLTGNPSLYSAERRRGDRTAGGAVQRARRGDAPFARRAVSTRRSRYRPLRSTDSIDRANGRVVRRPSPDARCVTAFAPLVSPVCDAGHGPSSVAAALASLVIGSMAA